MIAPFEYSLSTILTVLTKKKPVLLTKNPKFRWISTASSECKPNTLFVPLRGARDGHEFIKDALGKGASGFLCETNHPILEKLTKEETTKAIFVKDGLLALGKLANHHRNRFDPYVLAITGSSGKTTTKDLLGGLFSYLPRRDLVITEKNYNNEIGLPFTLFRIQEYTQVVVCELGMNHRGEIERLSKIAEPTHSLITNIGSAHIENLKKRETIALEKSDILLGMRKDGVLFVPDDLEFLSIVKQRAKKLKTRLLIWGHTKKTKLKIESTKRDGFVLGWNKNLIHWKLPGIKLLSNLRGVLEVAEYLALPSEQIIKTIQNFKSPNKRLDIKKGYFTIIDDSYNANPESMKSSIDASVQFAGVKNVVWILGTMKELGSQSKFYHKDLGLYIKNYGRGEVLVLGEPMKELTKVLRNSKYFETHTDLIEYTKTNIPKGSVILVKGSRSMKMETIVEALVSFKA
ncbi:UDP-N-acetylmuramoyl-tripeptide--D-alanyl-D-alanine ligase [Leptospira sp. 96542]|nr:UDP-N-acetylmuramoyl-tripeptide--D-alanyl-D-alanine ligase [Leptospira sp. 96542]